ncbi:MAG: hypothetical protein OXH95_02865 [bacterium]|nr:hypothetical protein [bacterium]
MNTEAIILTIFAAILAGFMGMVIAIMSSNEKSRQEDTEKIRQDTNKKLSEFKTEINGINENITELKKDLKTEINGNIADLKTEISRNNTEHQEAIKELRTEFRQELREEIGGLREEMNAGFARVNRRIDELILVVNPPESLAPVEMPEAKAASG